jgi:hypothetical protein
MGPAQLKGRSPSKNIVRLHFHSPSHAFFLDTIEEIHNKDASLFIHLKTIFIYLVSYGRNLGGFQDDYWKCCTSMVDELGLRMHAIFKVLWSPLNQGKIAREHTNFKVQASTSAVHPMLASPRSQFRKCKSPHLIKHCRQRIEVNKYFF